MSIFRPRIRSREPEKDPDDVRDRLLKVAADLRAVLTESSPNGLPGLIPAPKETDERV